MAWRTNLGYEAFLDAALSWLRMLVAPDGGVLEEDTLVYPCILLPKSRVREQGKDCCLAVTSRPAAGMVLGG